MSAPSPLEVLRARYEELARAPEPTVHVAVEYGVSDRANGSVGLLVEYRQPDWQQAREIDRKWSASNDPKADLWAMAEQLAGACVDIWVRDDDGGKAIVGFKGKWSPGLGLGEGNVAFAKAAQSLGLKANDGIQAVAAVLRFDQQIDDHARALAYWTPGPPPEVGKQFVGESQAATPS